jgi:hypothetical protein
VDWLFDFPVCGFPGNLIGNFGLFFVVIVIIVVEMDLYRIGFFGIVGSDGFPFNPLFFRVFVAYSSAFSLGLLAISAYVAYFIAVIAFA